jgi:hypothetical protein
MAICAAVDINPLNADVVWMQTTVTPPFRRTKQADNRGARRYGQMRWASVAAYVNFRASSQFVESFQRKAYRVSLARFAGLQNRISQILLTRPMRNERMKSVV